MPLETQIKRKGRSLPLRWSEFHVAAMVFAASWDSGHGPFKDNTDPRDRAEALTCTDGTVLDYPEDAYPVTPKDAWELTSYPMISATPLNAAPHVVVREHKFVDVTDGEVLHLLPGDVLKAWRS